MTARGIYLKEAAPRMIGICKRMARRRPALGLIYAWASPLPAHRSADSFERTPHIAAAEAALPGRPAPRFVDAVLEPHHTHFLIVPGDHWGAESPWIARTATALAGTAPSITVLINGGEIAYSDVERSLHVGRRVVVIAGSGRTADVIAQALAGTGADERSQALTESGLVHSVPADDPAALAELLAEFLGRSI